MKVSTWQFLAMIALVFAGIIVAHVVAPAAVATVVSIALTCVAFLTNRKDDNDA